jgi:hypothetical protein
VDLALQLHCLQLGVLKLIQELIPEYEKVLKRGLYEQLEKRLLQGLGLVDVIEGAASTRREAILNLKPFIVPYILTV